MVRYFQSGGFRMVGTVPNVAQKLFAMGKYNHLICAMRKFPYLLRSHQRTMFVHTGHRIVQNNYGMRQVGILLQRCQKERQCQRTTVTTAENIAERWLCFTWVGFNRLDRRISDFGIVRAGWAAPLIQGAKFFKEKIGAKFPQIAIHPLFVFRKSNISVLVPWLLCILEFWSLFHPLHGTLANRRHKAETFQRNVEFW